MFFFINTCSKELLFAKILVSKMVSQCMYFNFLQHQILQKKRDVASCYITLLRMLLACQPEWSSSDVLSPGRPHTMSAQILDISWSIYITISVINWKLCVIYTSWWITFKVALGTLIHCTIQMFCMHCYFSVILKVEIILIYLKLQCLWPSDSQYKPIQFTLFFHF